MNPKVNICLSIDIESIARLDPDKPEELDEQVKLLCDLLNDLRNLLAQYS
jgi:hypothetical protein